MATARRVFYTLCYVSLLTGTNWLLWMKRNFCISSAAWISTESCCAGLLWRVWARCHPCACEWSGMSHMPSSPVSPPPPGQGHHHFLCDGDWGINCLLVKRTWPRKAFRAINALAWEISAVLSILLLSLLFSKSTCEPMVRQPLWLIHLINRPLNWSLTSLHTFPKLLLTPETPYPAAHTGFPSLCTRTYWLRRKSNQTRNLYYCTITLPAKSLFFSSPVRTTTCFWLKHHSHLSVQTIQHATKSIQANGIYICFKNNNRGSPYLNNQVHNQLYFRCKILLDLEKDPADVM